MAEHAMPSSDREKGETVVQGNKTMVVNYPSNSNKVKAQAPAAKKETKPDAEVSERKMEKITTGKVVERKKSLGRKIAEAFGGGDDMQSVGTFLVRDVALPALKNLISEMVSQGVERTLFGDSARRTSSARMINRTFTNYGNYSKTSSPAGRAGEADGTRQLGHRERANHDFNSIILETRGEAEEVLDALREAADTYKVATVADLYDLVGITPEFTDQKWGWSDLRDSGFERVRDGYLLRFPKTEYID